MTGYPLILNGDHAAFEAEHANTQPEERPDWPLPSFVAADWAKAFCKFHPDCGVDEGTMLGWFANALMRGYDEHAARTTEEAVKVCLTKISYWTLVVLVMGSGMVAGFGLRGILQ